MKKKLIAIVTSLAMVASLVPATAFAATGTPENTGKAVTRTVTDSTAQALQTAMGALGTDIIAADGSSVAYTSYDATKEGKILAAINAYDALTAAGATDLDNDTAGTVAGYETKLKKLIKAVWDVRDSKLTSDLGDLTGAPITTSTAGTAVTTINNSDYVKADASFYQDATESKAVYNLLEAANTTGGRTNGLTGSDMAKTTVDDAKAAYNANVRDLKAAASLAETLVTEGLNTVTADTITNEQAKEIQRLVAANTTIQNGNVGAILDSTITDLLGTTGSEEGVGTIAKDYLATQSNIKAFLDAVKAIASKLPITSYDKGIDGSVEEACEAYDALSAADVASIKADADSRTLYEQFERAVEQQWDARLDALDYAVKDVTPVEMGAADKDSIAAIADLAKKCADITADGSVKMYTILSSTTNGAPAILTNNGTLRNTITTTMTNAGTALAEAQAVEDIVVAIAKLETVTDRNYVDVAKEIAKIETNYAALSADEQKRVGNYDELTAKKEAADQYVEEVNDAKELITEISKNLSDGTRTGKLTEKEIKDYTTAYNAANKAYSELGKEQRKVLSTDTVSIDGTSKTYKAFLDEAAENVRKYGIGLDKEIAVKDAISNLPAGTAAGDTLAIAKASVNFKALSNSDAGTLGDLASGFKANVNEVLKSRLSRAEAAILPTLKVNGTNKADDDAIATAVAPVKELIAALPATITSADEAAVDAALEAYKAITTAFDADAVVDTALTKALKDDEKLLRTAETQMKEILAKNRQAVERFIDAVKGINSDLDLITDEDSVDIVYRNAAEKARTVYDALTDEQKEMVQKGQVTDAKKAYDALLIAEKNVAGALTLDEVAALIKAVPNAATLKLDDTDAVAKVKAAQAAYEALSDGVKGQLVANKYLTQAELDNYLNAVKKVTGAESKTSVKEVTDAIKALIPLPTRFSSQTEVNTAYTLLTQAEELFNKLTKEQQASVTNKDVLTKYRTDFDRLMKIYADELYKKVAALDVTGDISAEDIAVIAELKAYIDGEYIETKEITGFDQKVYDALIALLDDHAALENATIADIPAVTVTDKSGTTVPTDAYEVTYSNNKDAGTALVTVSALTGKGYTGVTSKSFTINPASINTAKAAKIANQIYNKKAKTPAVTVTAGSRKLVKDADYKVSYKNNTNIGKATVTITGTENYTGTITTTFIITPAKGKLTSLKAGKKQITVSYEAQKASGKTGYYLVYSPAKGKAKTTATTATKKTIKGLKSGRTYKVKVRAYKTIDGKKYNGTYSAVKKVKVK